MKNNKEEIERRIRNLRDWIKKPTIKHILLNEYKAELKGIKEGKRQALTSFAEKIKEKVNQRKWVWNEEKFGNLRARRFFEELIKELNQEIDKLLEEE